MKRGAMRLFSGKKSTLFGSIFGVDFLNDVSKTGLFCACSEGKRLFFTRFFGGKAPVFCVFGRRTARIVLFLAEKAAAFLHFRPEIYAFCAFPRRRGIFIKRA